MKADFDHLFEECHEVTEQYRNHRSTALRVGQCILRLFAPAAVRCEEIEHQKSKICEVVNAEDDNDV